MNFSGSNRDPLSHWADVSPEWWVAAVIWPGAWCTMGCEVVGNVVTDSEPCLACTRTPAFVFDSESLECDFDHVQRVGVHPVAKCQNTFNLDSSDHPVRSSLNTRLTSCDRWCRTPAILPSSPNPVTGTFSPVVEPEMLCLCLGNKTKAGHRQPEKPDVSAVLRQGVGARNKAIPASGYYVAGEKITGRLSFVSSAERGRF